MSEREWWATFFDGQALELWRHATPPALTHDEVGRVLATTGTTPGAAVLDVPCGYGRHAVELASRGYRVVGVDACVEFIEEARAAAAARGVDAEFRFGDMRELPWDAAFDLAVCLGNSFAYLDDAGNAAFLAALGRSLRSGARFVLHTAAVAECVLPGLVEREWRTVGPLRLLTESRHDPMRGVLEVDYVVQGHGKEEGRTAVYRVYTVREVADLLERSSLVIESLSGPDGAPFASGDESLWLVARCKRT